MLTKIKSWWKSIREEKPKATFEFSSYQCDIEMANLRGEHDEQIEALANHYLSLVDSGLDLFLFSPQPPTGDMARNKYAHENYTRQLIAFARVVGMNKGGDNVHKD